MFGGLLQPVHLLVIVLIVVVILGPGPFKRAGHSLGQSWRALVAGFRAGAQPTPRPQAALPARPCAQCGTWSGETASYCTRCGAALG
jgi:sec-independent protein translocase protein TatA